MIIETRQGDAHGQSPSRPFVGRQHELSELVGALRAAIAGRGACRLIGGEPGIGKSRLADELAGIARADGVQVLWGRSWEAGGAPAYWPWIQSLRPLAADATVRRDLTPTHVGLLAQLFPEMAPEGQPVFNLDEKGVRFRLFEAVGELLRTKSARQPILLILEDADAADTPSQLLLRFVGAILPIARVLLVASYRDVQLRRDHPLRPVIAELLRDPLSSQLILRGLTEDDVGRYLEAALGRSPGSNLVALVHRETEGNPLFIGEVARLLVAQPELAAPGVRAERFAIPQTVREVIRQRLERLDERTREALAAGSVLGREFELEALGRLAGRSMDDLLDTIDEAIETRVLGELPEGPGRFRFAHVLIRDILYEDIPPSRRMRLHLAAAAALEALYGADIESHLAELAHHHLLAGSAGDPDAQVAWSRRAGERAVRLLAYEEAARLFEQALRVLSRRPDDRVRCELLVALGDARARAGDAATARDAFLAAADLARRLQLPDLLARSALGYGGRFVWEAGRGDTHLIPLLRDALAALPAEEGRLRAMVLARLAGGPLRDDPQREERDRLSAEAVDLARGLADPAILAYALDGRYAAVWWPENLGERLVIAREVIATSRQAGDRERELQGHHYLSLALLEAGDIAGAEAETADQARLANDLQQPSQLFYVATVQTTLALLRGRYAEAEELISRASALGQRAEPSMARIYAAIQLHALRRAQGRLGEILPQVIDVASAYPSYVVLRCVLVDVLRELGRGDDARRELAALAANRFAALQRGDEWLFGMCLLGEAAAELAMSAEVKATRELLEPYRGRVSLSPPDSCMGAVDRVLGLLDGALGNDAEAREHFAAAISLNEALGSPPWAAAARLDLASLLLRSGEEHGERATSLLQDVVASARELGMPVLERRASELLESAGFESRGARIERTFMFTDIVRSTDLIEAIGDEAWEDLLRWHDRTLQALFAGHRSVDVSHRGDGFFAVFDEGASAVACALEIQDTLASHRRSDGFAPSVRIGLHTAPARLSGGVYSGQGVHAAARIGALAGPGEILASRVTVEAVPGVQYEAARRERLKGIRDPVEVVRLVPTHSSGLHSSTASR